MSNILQEIIRHKRAEIAELPAIEASSLSRSDRDFTGALRGRSRAVIAELKPRSPSAGELCGEYRPAEIARRYEQAGASAISVLTDAEFFGGKAAHLTQARESTSLPVLRKDFILDHKQVLESRHLGADACLLIVAALEPGQLRSLKLEIEAWGMTALIEVHNQQELEVALACEPAIVGINNRNLADLSIDLETTHRLCPLIPDGVVVISESGIAAPEEVAGLPARVNGVLIGTALMRSPDAGAFIKQVLESREAVP